LDIQLLEHLTQTNSPSGYEENIRQVIKAYIEDYIDDLRTDPLGSLVGFRKGTIGGKSILLSAHMDEIGLMVTHVEEKGFLRFTSIGGLRPMNCIGGRAVFSDGTIGAIYLEHRESNTNIPELKHLYIDVGATSREECPVRVGDTAVFVGSLVKQNNRLMSKAMDDRIGCYILIEVLRQLDNPCYDVHFVFSTQEEITLSGAQTSAFRIDPDIAISVDVTLTGDTPKAIPMAVSLGKGPAVKIKDGGMIAHPIVREMLIDAAVQAGIPYQLEVLLGGTTDAAVMQLVRAGVPSGCLSIPCRLVHSTSELVDQDDVENAITVLKTLLTSQ
jgi:putative aminopeptidase FrvX